MSWASYLLYHKSLCMGPFGCWSHRPSSIKSSVFQAKSSHQEFFCVAVLLASSAQLQWWRKQENKESNRFNKQNKNSAHAAHFLADFFAFITWKTLSNLIGNAIIYSTLKIVTVLIGPGIVETSVLSKTPMQRLRRSYYLKNSHLIVYFLISGMLTDQ